MNSLFIKQKGFIHQFLEGIIIFLSVYVKETSISSVRAVESLVFKIPNHHVWRLGSFGIQLQLRVINIMYDLIVILVKIHNMLFTVISICDTINVVYIILMVN